MQILIADDDPISRRLATHALAGCGADVAVAEDGHGAWAQIQGRTQSTVLILDRLMPGIDGVDLCKGARLLPSFPPLYILMVTSASETSDVTAGLDAGADDYVIKPFKPAELKARAQVGMRMVALQESMARRLAELEQALANVKALRGLLPMCSYLQEDSRGRQVLAAARRLPVGSLRGRVQPRHLSRMLPVRDGRDTQRLCVAGSRPLAEIADCYCLLPAACCPL